MEQQLVQLEASLSKQLPRNEETVNEQSPTNAELQQQLAQLQAALALQTAQNEEVTQLLLNENARLHEKLAIVEDVAEKNRVNLWKRGREDNRLRAVFPCKVTFFSCRQIRVRRLN